MTSTVARGSASLGSERRTAWKGVSAASVNGAAKWGGSILASYQDMDRIVGEVMQKHPEAVLMVVSDHGFASYSPVTDGKLVFAYFGSRGLHCFDVQGNLKWQKDLGRMQTRNGFGEGSSPALHGDTLVVNWDHEGDDFIVALDK